MEIREIVPFVLILLFVGMLIGVGTLTLDKYARAVRTTTTKVSTGNNFSTGSSLDLTDSYCLSVTSIDNGTTTFSLTTYNVTLSNADGCVFSYSTIAACTLPLCNITYTYGAETKSATAATSVNDAITPIASTWLPLVVTVVILAIILTLVISSFGFGNRR